MHQIRWFGSSTGDELLGHNAYEVLGVSETSTFSDIKTSFRRLAKETHPDLSPSPTASRQFLLIVAAYEILSDSERRAQYDSNLLSQRRIPEKQPGLGRHVYACNLSVNTKKQIEAVEWLELYRLAIDDILSYKKVASNSGFGIIENEFYSAICAAYYGPLIESLDFLPDCFEAEERSDHETSEVLHLVSGRDLFGMVNLVNHVPWLSHNQHDGLVFLDFMNSKICQSAKCAGSTMNLASSGHGKIPGMQVENHDDHVSDAYDDLELQISGRVVATATRISPSNLSSNNSVGDPQDHIHVFLKLSEEHAHASRDVISSSVGSMILLGTIKGLDTSPEEGSCFVYDRRNEKTHVIMKHRTLMVKHMYWYQIGDEISTCECRCSRACLPPSKFWLFAPRCGMHDVGGWYIETFGKDKNGRNVPSQRQWDDVVQHHEK